MSVRSNPLAFFAHFWKRRELIGQFTRLEFVARYHGSQLGVLWSLASPFFTLLVYTFVFSVIFKPRWANAVNAGFLDYALILFTGITAFEIFAACANRAPYEIADNSSYVKKMVFPLEILAVSILFSAMIESLPALGLVVLGVACTTGKLHATLLLLPLAYAPLVFLTLAVCWTLNALGVFMRDVGHVVRVFTQLYFFLTPILFPAEAVPEQYRYLLPLNPMYVVVEHFRRFVLWGQGPAWTELSAVTLVTFVLALLAYRWFMRVKGVFADVI
ncbi:MAG: ABC transporter permease [Desulfovibrionaceae bacterium]|nr:ABC transporter permease [Desulfovibrionaceae bacterium]MBF0514909.1 ABC transporter permease [Desulfovibrionaceae bacterium]